MIVGYIIQVVDSMRMQFAGSVIASVKLQLLSQIIIFNYYRGL